MTLSPIRRPMHVHYTIDVQKNLVEKSQELKKHWFCLIIHFLYLTYTTPLAITLHTLNSQLTILIIKLVRNKYELYYIRLRKACIKHSLQNTEAVLRMFLQQCKLTGMKQPSHLDLRQYTVSTETVPILISYSEGGYLKKIGIEKMEQG